MTDRRGRLIVVSGPSGSGKSTLLERVFERASQPLAFSVSATTRQPRPGEVDGSDYHFMSDDEFQQRRRRGEFLECFEVYGKDHWYGTLESEVTPGLESGKWVVLDIDVQGARAVLERYRDAVTLFVWPGSLSELERRLRGRGTEDEAVIAQRLAEARHELEQADQYQFRVVNDDLDRAVREVCDILTQVEGES